MRYSRSFWKISRLALAPLFIYGSYKVYESQKQSFIHLDVLSPASCLSSAFDSCAPCSPILPSRADLLKRLDNKNDQFDLLIIGGGATGSGVAVEAARRGLKVALVEQGDFASQTSSKSTKLIHGGVRYLQNAVFKLDIGEYFLVREALHERKWMVNSVPYLTEPLPFVLPIYSYWQVPYFWAGLKAYDFISGTSFFRSSYFLSPTKSRDLFPFLKEENLKGSVVYYDGQQDDARMNLVIALTAISHGVAAANYVKAVKIVNDKQKNVSVVELEDQVTKKRFKCSAKVVVNASGPFTDSVRCMHSDECGEQKICQGAIGTHIVLPGYFCPKNMGILDPATKDDRVLYILQWKGHTVAGTTDIKTPIVDNPSPTIEEVDFILSEINSFYLPDVKATRKDVLAAWSGIRPLVKDPSKTDTKSFSRSHVIDVVGENLVTIAGGKWTTYRAMAEDTVDKCLEVLLKNTDTEDDRNDQSIKRYKIAGDKGKTSSVTYYGTSKWTPHFYFHLIKTYGLTEAQARHLSTTYGSSALNFLERFNIGPHPEKGHKTLKMLHQDFPYSEQEVVYCAEREFSLTVVDFLARRVRLAFINARVAEELVEKVADLMAYSLKWDQRKKNEEIKNARDFINVQMGLSILNQ